MKVGRGNGNSNGKAPSQHSVRFPATFFLNMLLYKRSLYKRSFHELNVNVYFISSSSGISDLCPYFTFLLTSFSV